MNPVSRTFAETESNPDSSWVGLYDNDIAAYKVLRWTNSTVQELKDSQCCLDESQFWLTLTFVYTQSFCMAFLDTETVSDRAKRSWIQKIPNTDRANRTWIQKQRTLSEQRDHGFRRERTNTEDRGWTYTEDRGRTCTEDRGRTYTEDRGRTHTEDREWTNTQDRGRHTQRIDGDTHRR